ncbi:hypothetical protein [Bradyrhizobium neotropicale]|uniref:hypothetical protein n=1 Tax=Bradyrhizobium neotropicale TaxID=1497615 RepID=UPI001FED3159|nr:hypothetical protein [Bradyrhizobium neotropicale]
MKSASNDLRKSKKLRTICRDKCATSTDLNAERAKALGNIRMMIYGNYGVRAAAAAMQETFDRMIRDGGVQNVHWDILPVEGIFRLQKMDEV